MDIHHILTSASLLIDPSEKDTDRTLAARIAHFYSSLAKQSPDLTNYSRHDLQLETAKCAIDVVQRVQQLLDAVPDTSKDRPVIGTRDLNLLRTLLIVVFRWGIDPLLDRLTRSWSAKQHATPTISDSSNSLADLRELHLLLASLVSILFPRGVHASPPQTLITTTILDRHVSDLLKASIALGWLPRSLAPEEDLSLHNLRQPALRLLEFLPLPQIMTDLGAILSNLPPPPSHVRKLCSSLLTKSLLRPGGVRALFAAVFGEQESSDDPHLEKYERTAGILKVVPTGLKPEEYFTTIIPPLMEMLSDNVPVTYRRATSFTISRMLDPGFAHCALVSSLLLPTIHLPMMQISPDSLKNRTQENLPALDPMTPSRALSALTILLLNTDPSPVLITVVLSPVVPTLYALMFHLDRMKASDPVLKESVRSLLETWGRVVERQEGVDTLASIMQNERIYWQVDITGEIKRGSSDKSTKLSLLTPEDLKHGNEAMVEDFLDLYPDPAHFVEYIKSLNRPDIVSELFVTFLETYHSTKVEQDTDPSRVLLYLQMIVQMQTRLSDDPSPTNILRKPEHVLLFVKHTLESQGTSATTMIPNKPVHSRGLGLDDLRIVENAEDVVDDGDSDDEEPGAGNQPEDNIIETAINLLLAVLEANPELSARSAPVLNEIFALLDPFSNDASASTRALAREARMVMTARLASTSTSWPAPREKDEESPQEIYQKALKLLQDPILPVRAHGLLLLRQLVSGHPNAPTRMAEPALVPAIMSIFMQSIQDDDSYIFLNAVQGLSAMVDAFGKEVLGNLLETYTRNVSGVLAVTLSKQEVDAKVRIGEALGQVIRRCGDTLSIHADTIVPRLILVFRASQAPTVLRTSAVSLLTECVKTSLVSVLRYANDLTTGMIDLLQVEIVSTPQSLSGEGVAEERTAEEREGKEVLDSKPTAVDSKLPPLRRAALYFWTLFLQELTRAIYDGAIVENLPTTFLRRAKVTLGYIASTDADGIVRVMAREANEAIDQLNKATLGM